MEAADYTLPISSQAAGAGRVTFPIIPSGEKRETHISAPQHFVITDAYTGSPRI